MNRADVSQARSTLPVAELTSPASSEEIRALWGWGQEGSGLGEG